MNGGTEQSGEGHSPSQVVRNGLIACTLGYAFVAIAPVIVASSEVHGAAIDFWRSWIDYFFIRLVCIFRKKMKKRATLMTLAVTVILTAEVSSFDIPNNSCYLAIHNYLTGVRPIFNSTDKSLALDIGELTWMFERSFTCPLHECHIVICPSWYFCDEKVVNL